MKTIKSIFCLGLIFLLHLPSCMLEPDSSRRHDNKNDSLQYDGDTIANHQVAKESVLRSIPIQYINTARNNFHVAYQHTSHGTHVSRGVFGLQDYKTGDDILFGVKAGGTGTDGDGKLDFFDYGIPGASDLSANETAFIQATRDFLDDATNEKINIIMWSWCNIAGHDVSGNYLPGMTALISEYGTNGSKIGTGAGQRKNAVTFILMTGHANTGNNTCDTCPKSQADLILQYCRDNNQYCLDYYSIDTHDLNDTYYEDAGDNGNSTEYGGNFYQDWQDSHTFEEDWYNNKTSPGGSVDYGEHNTQHITANRKAYAFWWILARIAGWDG